MPVYRNNKNLNNQSWLFSEFGVNSVALIPPTLACLYRQLDLFEYPAIGIPPWLRFLEFTSDGCDGVMQIRVFHWIVILALFNSYSEYHNGNKVHGPCLRFTEEFHCCLDLLVDGERILAAFKLMCSHLVKVGQRYLLAAHRVSI